MIHNTTIGAGSGGGTEKHDQSTSFDGGYSVAANQIQLVSRAPMPPASPDDCQITLLASDIEQLNGTVNLRGMGGVRITAGPPPLPPTVSGSTQGVEIEVGELQNVTIKRGLIDGVDQVIEMAPGSIKVDGGMGTVTIQSMTEITLSVCGGLSSIVLGPTGITIQGLPLVKIN